jgi:hypothetical protein
VGADDGPDEAEEDWTVDSGEGAADLVEPVVAGARVAAEGAGGATPAGR